MSKHTEQRVAVTLLRARLRRERRLRDAAAVAALWPRPEAMRAIDLTHEATRSVDRLEKHLWNVREDARIDALLRRETWLSA
jgi:hypothetical protein